MILKEDDKLNNKGLSLVELIIAISIGVIVAGSIAALMNFAIRIYRNESVNASTQYELQTNINMMMDEVMESSTVVVVQRGGGEPQTKYAMFGTVTPGDKKSDPVIDPFFKGVIFVPSKANANGRFKLYMKKVESAFSGTLQELADDEYDVNFGDFDTDSYDPDDDTERIQYLMGENATQFEVKVDPNGGTDGRCLKKNVKKKRDVDDPDTWEYEYNYVNPIEVGVKLKFEKDGWGGRKFEKQVDEVVYMRNKVRDTIYVDGQSYDL